jgi:hypothetical protein
MAPGEIDRGVEPMPLRRFPKLRIARGKMGADGEPDAYCGGTAGNRLDDRMRRVVSGAVFVFTRETESLANVARVGTPCMYVHQPEVEETSGEALARRAQAETMALVREAAAR